MSASPTTANNLSSTPPQPNGHTTSSMKITFHTSRTCIPPAAASLCAAFTTDPVLRWVLLKPDHTSLLDDQRFISTFFRAVVSAGLSSGGTVVSSSQLSANNGNGDVNGFPCVGILVPPGSDPEATANYIRIWRQAIWVAWHAGLQCGKRILAGYPNMVKELKKGVFSKRQEKERDYYYIFFLGTVPKHRGRGLAGNWLENAKREAEEKGKPIWLESSSEKSRDLYVRHGFELVSELTVGKGDVDEEGVFVGGGKGKGARLWGMVWWPEELKEKYRKEGKRG